MWLLYARTQSLIVLIVPIIAIGHSALWGTDLAGRS